MRHDKSPIVDGSAEPARGEAGSALFKRAVFLAADKKRPLRRGRKFEIMQATLLTRPQRACDVFSFRGISTDNTDDLDLGSVRCFHPVSCNQVGIMTSPFEFPDDRPITGRPSRRRPASRGFARFLVAICIGIAGTLAWQSYGETTKQIIAKRAPELGWSPEAKQAIASSIEWLGWTKSRSLENTSSQTVAPKAPTAPSLDPAQVQQMVQNLAALREMIQQLTAGQDQTRREIDKLESAVVEILMKIPEPPPQPPAAPARKPAPVPPPSSRVPPPQPSSRPPQ